MALRRKKLPSVAVGRVRHPAYVRLDELSSPVKGEPASLLFKHFFLGWDESVSLEVSASLLMREGALLIHMARLQAFE